MAKITLNDDLEKSWNDMGWKGRSFILGLFLLAALYVVLPPYFKQMVDPTEWATGLLRGEEQRVQVSMKRPWIAYGRGIPGFTEIFEENGCVITAHSSGSPRFGFFRYERPATAEEIALFRQFWPKPA